MTRPPTGEVRQLDVVTPDGRVLHVHDDGEPGDERVPLLLHHGTPQSALLLGSQLAAARARGIRLVGYDRPGYGGSSRQAGRRVADAASDAATVADALGLDRFLTSGASGGGPHALACAARLGDRVAAVATVAGVAPHDAAGLDWLGGMGDDNVVEFSAAAAGPDELVPVLELGRAMMLAATPETLAEGMASLLPPADLVALRGGIGTWLHDSAVAALAQGHDGWLDDDLAFVQDWGFDLADVQAPLLVVAGGQDLMVPVAHGEWLAETVPGASRSIDPDAGHLSLLAGVDAVHGWLLDRW
ncbi:alpha/beta fold hydrolase [Angustibacter luteus]|uniref:Alpha/beta fold hydrolase n=1 Tax=Angustibacter luteus TaxID=658456 RepID=A0ABW1JI41_9ACTN